MQPYDPSQPRSGAAEGDPDMWAQRPESEKASSGRKTSKKAGSGKGEGEWARDVLEKLAFAALKEQRRARRWRLLFTLIVFGYLGFLTWTVMSSVSPQSGAVREHTAMVRINGVIGEDRDASARYLVRSLRSAFESDLARAVVLNINSPGGSPVQAGIIHDEILRLKAMHQKPVYAVIGDLGASAAYYIAVAADEIYVDKASLVGSIGVILNGFGFTGTMEKLGVERRLLTAGGNKGFMDPFSPERPDDVNHAQQMLGQIHQQFIAVVRAGRGARLKETPDTFSGQIWVGEQAVAQGLADHFGSIYSVARDVVERPQIVNYTRTRSFADQLTNRLGNQFGQSASQGLLQGLESQQGMAWQ